MKITAEFNSNEELLNFINTFGTTNIIQKIGPNQRGQASTEKKDIKKEESKSIDLSKQDTKKEKNPPAEQTKKEDKPIEEPKTEDSKSEITKEVVRAVFTKLVKAGKAKEAKEITLKYGAKKVPDLKEENYAAVVKEVEALL
ncbi:hypothetical protein RBU49_11750 [Clostridium sp. MB40-C1]|uniref:hypothetical protein n=1 Tax=Clostridium sp. MB40-C1 TaxID=3070996 RepID=UPI0027E0BA5E|nr:hypothetical protein [Clostridium sp. MB40-C1]WMJ79563.1 hypothetical protein RBU49_11750 [Clostridium sp. MB40-C1]